MIPLDTFLKSQQNISKKIEAWLTLIAAGDMGRIRKVLEAYPEFGEIYCQVFQFRRKVEELMGMYSEALRILDANTVKYMIEQQQEEIEQQREEIQRLDQTVENKDAELQSKDQELDSIKREMSQKDQRIRQLEEMIARVDIK